MEIEVQVARVLSPSEVALNAGADRGIEVGDAVKLFETIEIRDPKSNEVLGSVRKSRLDLEIRDVQDRFSIARVSIKYNPLNGIFGMQDKFITGRDIKKDETITLNAGDAMSVYVSDDSDEGATEKSEPV